jgi:membrane protein
VGRGLRAVRHGLVIVIKLPWLALRALVRLVAATAGAMVRLISRMVGGLDRGWDAAIEWLRERSDGFDHLWRARQRYNAHLGGRLAASIAYYGFFAAFALSLVAYSVLGFVLPHSDTLRATVDRFLSRNMPFLRSDDILHTRTTVAVAGLAALILAGVGWVDGMRSAQRAIWELVQQPGNLVIRRLVDLATLLGLGLLVGFSIWATNGLYGLTRVILLALEPPEIARWAQLTVNGSLKVLSWTLAFVVNLVTAAALLVAVPRLRVSPRRMLVPTLLVAIGLTGLTTIGQVFVNHVSHNPAYRVVGVAAGLLVFLNLFSQILLYGAALAATSTRGRVTDLAAGPPPSPPLRPPSVSPPTEAGS